MTKLEELKTKKAALIANMKAHLDADEIEKAKSIRDQIADINSKIDIQEIVDKEEREALDNKAKKIGSEDKTEENASFIRAAIKKFSGRSLTETENALLLPTTSNTNGTNGEGFILPQDIQTQINKKIREYRSMREILGYMQTSALSGRFPVENFDTVTGLIDFADGTDGTEADDIKFTSVSYTLSEKGALIQLSNTLLALTDNQLISYVVEVFAKKAVVTENTLATDALKNGKTVKTLDDWKALKSSINKDLDPAALFGTVIATNQDGFDFLDSALDENGRPILQPNPANPTERLFAGYPVKVYSNAILPSSAATSSKDGYAPIFYGDIANGAKFIDLGNTNFATSSEAGFTRNTTYARLIEFIAAVQVDSSDKCYIYGQLKVADKTGA